MPRHRNPNKKSNLTKPNSDKIRELINDKEDFIASKRFNCSLKEFSERYPNGAPNKAIANALMISEQEVEALYESIVLKVRSKLKISV